MANVRHLRRDILRAAAAGLALSACGQDVRPRPAPGPGPSSRKAIVVGAGLSGLTAALGLEAAGWEVEILESAERVGGRVLTVRDSPLPDAVHMEAGGGTFRPDDRELMDLIQRLGLDTEAGPRPRSGQDLALCVNGASLRADDLLSESQNVGAIARLDAALANLRGEEATAEDDQSVRDLINNAGLTDPIAAYLRVAATSILGRQPELASATQLARRWRAPGATEETLGVAGGADTLITSLTSALDARVTRRASVSAVTETGGGVVVAHSLGSSSGDRVVLAVPAAALRMIILPTQDPAAAMTGLDPGLLTRVLMVYPTPAWEDASLFGTMFTDGAVSSTHPVSGPEGIAEGLLTVDGAGASASLLLALSEVTGGVKQEVDRCLPAPPIPGGRPAVTTAWDGGLAAFPALPIGWLATADERARPHGRVHLAGDHTSAARPGTLEGAVQAGRRAAAEVISA